MRCWDIFSSSRQLGLTSNPIPFLNFTPSPTVPFTSFVTTLQPANLHFWNERLLTIDCVFLNLTGVLLWCLLVKRFDVCVEQCLPVAIDEQSRPLPTGSLFVCVNCPCSHISCFQSSYYTVNKTAVNIEHCCWCVLLWGRLLFSLLCWGIVNSSE